MAMFAIEPKLDCPHLASYIEESESSRMQTVDSALSSIPQALRFKLGEIYQGSNYDESFQGLCKTCSASEENWICLRCNEFFCSRYINAHMASHNSESLHELALSLSDGSFWCYECDSYVYSRAIRDFATEFGRLKHVRISDTPANAEVLSTVYEEDESLVQDEEPLITKVSFAEEKYEEEEENKEGVATSVTSELKDALISLKPHPPHPPITPPITRRMAVYSNKLCENHWIPNHPEQPNRVKFILKALSQTFPDLSYREATPATDEQLTLFHSPALVAKFHRLADKSEKTREPVNIDGDTTVMYQTRTAAYLAAGAYSRCHVRIQ